jgi:phosphatidylglycerophosphate synthase
VEGSAPGFVNPPPLFVLHGPDAVNGNSRMKPAAAAQPLYTLPNLVTLFRLLGILPFALLSAEAQHPYALRTRWAMVLLYGLIISSDTLDGWLARRLGQANPLGRALDHVSDIVFILTALGTFALQGRVPWWLPAAIAWAFALYLLDSWWRTARQPHRQLLGSRLGHLGGVLNYVTVGLVTVQVCTDGRWLSPGLLHLWFLGLAGLALLSGSERLWLLVRTSRAADTL